MIAHAKRYGYDLIHGVDAYGFPCTITNAGYVSMSVYLRNTYNVDNPLYAGAEYIAYTFDNITDGMIIHTEYGDLKATTVQPSASRWAIVYLTRINNGNV